MNSRQLAQSWPYPRHKVFVRALRSSASAWFGGKGYATHPGMPYCLDRWDNWQRNIILPEVADYISQVKSECKRLERPFPLHKYIHHGLSSQAMVFNLIGPLVVRNDWDPLRLAVSKKGLEWPDGCVSAQFEYEDRSVFKEDTGQPTSIDLVIKDAMERPRIFIEGKLVEQEFGGCSVFSEGDCDGGNPCGDLSRCYLHRIGRRYWELLYKHHFTDSIKQEMQCILAFHHQFFRELVFSLEKGGNFLLLSDERSPVFHCRANNNIERGLMPLLLQFVPKSYRKRVDSVSVQELVQEIKQSGSHSWIAEFEKKYGLA